MDRLYLPTQPRLFAAPALSSRELEVIDQVDTLRSRLRHQVTHQARWAGSLRRVSLARAIRGSNSIEGINVSLDDAVAAADGEEPLEATQEVWAAIVGYGQALTYVMQLAGDPHFSYSDMLLRSLHYMMVQHDLGKSPGLWRPGDIYVLDEESGETVYRGPDAELIPALVTELVRRLNDRATTESALVTAAMAHLNLVMIHPFRDGNGRMARALQTLVLAREGILSPHFCSIEEYLGRNTGEYYRVLGAVGRGSWQPENDCGPWIRFSLTAHLRQARTLLRRMNGYEQLWDRLEGEIQRLGSPLRTITALSDAAIGLRVRNATYRVHEEATPVTAGRDLKQLADAGLLTPHGEKRGRYYVGSDALRAIWSQIQQSQHELAVEDPFGAA